MRISVALLLGVLCSCASDEAPAPMNTAPVEMMPAGGTGATPPAAAGTGAAGASGGRDAAMPVDASTGTARDAGAAGMDAGARDASSNPAPMDAASPDAAPAPDSGAMTPDTGPMTPDTGMTPPGESADRCDVAQLDPAKAPTTLALSGSLGTHDPTLIESKGTYYLWFTGPRVPAKTSTDLKAWKDAPAAFGSTNPAWVAREVPEATDLWAPDVSFFGNQFHLYYSASKWGSNSSCIGHATRPALDSGSWMDQGPVICSNHGTRDDWNAIDPNVVVDTDGKPWLSFGSFWSGIKAIELDMQGKRANQQLHSLATRPSSVDGAIEAPFIVRRCGYYYLFASFDKCCSGANSTYNTRVGRSEKITGPYVDMEGKSMLQGGGSLVLMGGSRYHGPGHNAVLFVGKEAYNVYHTYDGQMNGRSILRVSELRWNDAKWPVSGGP